MIIAIYPPILKANIFAGGMYRYEAIVSSLTIGQIRYQLGATDIVNASINGAFSGDYTVLSVGVDRRKGLATLTQEAKQTVKSVFSHSA